MKQKSGVYTAGLVTVGIGALLGVAGGFGLIQGMPTRSLSTTSAILLLMGGLSLVVGLVLLGQGHSDAPLKFCNRCGSIVDDGDASCSSCGHALAS
jgi:hypothetical protein